MSETFKLNLAEFEGPLDLLLYLVRKDDLNILELSMSDVADQYVSFIEQMQELNLDVASEYLVMAATLAWVKSRLMLPRVQESDEDIEDLRAELIEKLLEYERFKRAAESLEDRPLLGRELFPASVEVVLPEGEDRPWAPVSIFALMEAFAEVLASMPEPVSQGPLQFVMPTRTVEEGASSLQKIFKNNRRCTLSDIVAGAKDKADIIVRFLALLELIKVGELVAVREEGSSGEIHVMRRHDDVDSADYSALVKGAYDGIEEDRTDS